MSLRRFKPYPAYSQSRVEWLGEIPAHWEVKRLWHLTRPDRRIMYGIVLPGPNVEEGVPIVKGGDVSPERLRLNRLNRTAFEIESAYVRSRLRGGDLVYAIRGSIGCDRSRRAGGRKPHPGRCTHRVHTCDSHGTALRHILIAISSSGAARGLIG